MLLTTINTLPPPFSYNIMIASCLYIVPTPIGNLEDISYRAVSVLKKVDIILAEDTRITRVLLNYFNIKSRIFSLHEHNEKLKADLFILKLIKGMSIALVCDAGTPLINDPGYVLVKKSIEANIKIIPLPGPCAAITALSASGLSTKRFCFEGFLPSKPKKRIKYLNNIKKEERTLIVYESKHRLLKTLEDLYIVLGSNRYVVIARELTKRWESIHGAPVKELISWVKQNRCRQAGEMVLIINGYHETGPIISDNIILTIKLLRSALSIKRAAFLVSKIYSINKRLAYVYILNNNP